MRLMLNMIVKNEGARIERALSSVAPYIAAWAIFDTGSTDDTKDRITAFFSKTSIPGAIGEGEFRDFSQARNDALVFARKLHTTFPADYFLLCDADMQLVVGNADEFLKDRNGYSYTLRQHAGPLHYTNSRLLHVDVPASYRGVTHEYLDVATTDHIPDEVAHFIDHADGSNRKDKSERDIRLLKQGLKDEPDNARYMFYLASSYSDAGKHDKAVRWYQNRIKAGGWDEEVWSAHVRLAHSLKEIGDTDGFVSTLLAAYCLRPIRAEAMYDLARWYREQPNRQAAALACAEAVEHLPKSSDTLFVNDFVYAVGVREEISITASYVPGKLAKGLRVTDILSLDPTPYHWARIGARSNLYWYLRPLVDFCPSFKWRQIPLQPPENYVAMNPSITVHNEKVHVNVRTVNYRIDEAGRYIITATDGTANADNPIDTRNFLIDLGTAPMQDSLVPMSECYRPGNMPVEFPLVTGFEDVRLFSWRNELWCTATVRQLHEDGNCEQVLSRIDPCRTDGCEHTNIKRMLREPRMAEKNWAPIQLPNNCIEPLFMWRPGIVVNTRGEPIINCPPKFTIDHLSGSSQVIRWKDGFLAVLHTAHPLPGEPYKRYYYHRFIEYTRDFRVRRISLPFCFNERVIEFCNGLCKHPADGSQLLLSYGFKDAEARLACVSASEVETMLEFGHAHDGS